MGRGHTATSTFAQSQNHVIRGQCHEGARTRNPILEVGYEELKKQKTEHRQADKYPAFGASFNPKKDNQTYQDRVKKIVTRKKGEQLVKERMGP